MDLRDYSVKAVKVGYSDIVKHDIHHAAVFLGGRETTRGCHHSHGSERMALKCVKALSAEWETVLKSEPVVSEVEFHLWQVETLEVSYGKVRNVVRRFRFVDETAPNLRGYSV